MCFEACPITEEARLPTLPLRPHSQSYLAFVEDTEALMGVLCPSATSFYICAIVFQCSLSDPVMKDMAPVPFWCPGLLETTVPHQGSELHNPKTISSTSSSQRLRAPKLVQSISHSMLTPSCSKQATNTRKRWGRMGNTNYLKGRCQQTLASQDQLDQTQTLQSPLRVNEGMETVLTLKASHYCQHCLPIQEQCRAQDSPCSSPRRQCHIEKVQTSPACWPTYHPSPGEGRGRRMARSTRPGEAKQQDLD